MIATAPGPPVLLGRTTEQRIVWSVSRPLTFEEYLRLFEGVDARVELVGGIPVERNGGAPSQIAAHLQHERLFNWVYRLVSQYAEDGELGEVLGSRTAVKTNEYAGRLPDILYIRRENQQIAREDGVYGAPDLVIELLSPGDGPAHANSLETEYRELGVPEIWFVDRVRGRVRVVRRGETDYEVEDLWDGTLRSTSLSGFWLPVSWLLTEDRPKPLEALARIRGQARAEEG